MASTSNPIRQLDLRNAQVLLHEREDWMFVRGVLNRAGAKALHRYGRVVDPRNDIRREAIDRLYAVRDSKPLFKVHLASGTLLPTLNSQALDSASASLSAGDDNIDSRPDGFRCEPWSGGPSALPPAVINIRFIPRRPGAPSTQLPH